MPLGNGEKFKITFIIAYQIANRSASYFTIFICKHSVKISLNRLRIYKIWLWEL